jgi:hypothetical protein
MNDETVPIRAVARITYGDGRAAMSMLAGGKHGMIFAEMQTPGKPGEIGMLDEYIEGTAIAVEFTDRAAVGRVIERLEAIREGMPA